MSTNLLWNIYETPEVDLEEFPGFIFWCCLDFTGNSIPGIVDDDTESAKMFFDFLEDLYYSHRVRHIQAGDEELIRWVFLGIFGKDVGSLKGGHYPLSRCQDGIEYGSTHALRRAGNCENRVSEKIDGMKTVAHWTRQERFRMKT